MSRRVVADDRGSAGDPSSRGSSTRLEEWHESSTPSRGPPKSEPAAVYLDASLRNAFRNDLHVGRKVCIKGDKLTVDNKEWSVVSHIGWLRHLAGSGTL